MPSTGIARCYCVTRIALVSLRRAENLHHAGEQPVGAVAHGDRLGREPYAVDADRVKDHRIFPFVRAADFLDYRWR